jgi:thioredoxin-related protein
MKRIITLAVCFLSGAVIFASEAVGNNILFETDFTIATKKANENSMYQVLVFNAEWCLPCKWMEKNTFTDDALINYLNKNSISSKINIDSEDGYKVMSKFNVKVLPTLIVLNAKGEEISRKQELMDGKSMLKFISNYIPSYYPKQPNTEHAIKAAPKTDSFEKESVKTTPPKSDDPSLSETIGTNGSLFIVAPKEIEAKGYGVQVGVFTNYEKAMKEAERLQKLVQASDLLVYNQDSDKGTKYKLIFGSFKTATEANNFLIALKKQQIEGLLKDLGAL